MSKISPSFTMQAVIQIGIVGLGVMLCVLAKAQTPVTSCDRLYPTAERAQSKEACRLAVAEAKYMLDQYARGWGRIDGYKKAFTETLNQQLPQYMNDAISMSEGEQMVKRGEIYRTVPVVAAGIEKACKLGTDRGSVSARDVIANLFTRNVAINPGNPPAFDHSVGANTPELTYVVGDATTFSALVGIRSERDFLKTYFENPASEALGQTIFYEDHAGTRRYHPDLLGVPAAFDPWDFYTLSVGYTPDEAKHGSAAAFNVWKSLHGAEQDRYRAMTTETITTIPPSAPGQPVHDPVTVTFDLKAIFTQTFVAQYNEQAEQQYLSTFNSAISDGVLGALSVAPVVGRNLAIQKGEAIEFNRDYPSVLQRTYQAGCTIPSRRTEPVGFLPGFIKTYQATYDSEFSNFTNNPKADFVVERISGAYHDRIIEPGEALQPSFKIYNYGGVEGSYIVDISGAQKSTVHTYKAAPYSVIEIKDAKFGKATSTSLVFVVEGISGTASQGYSRAIPESILLTAEITPHSIVQVPHVLAGTAEISLKLHNNSDQFTAHSMVTVTLLDANGAQLQTKSLSPELFQPGQDYPVSFTVTGLSPLAMLDGISFGVTDFLSQTPEDGGATGIKVQTQNMLVDLPAVFNSLAQTGTDAATVNGVLTRVYNAIHDEVKKIHRDLQQGSAVYEKHPETMYMGQVESNHAHTTQSATAKTFYRELAKRIKDAKLENELLLLWQATKNSKAFHKMVNELEQ